ncbi:MAG: ABC transporter permease [Candidatus Riflebacteria bacterium]|nr:ABC transporter permease [Candidatus Riflebacteria bacterium]
MSTFHSALLGVLPILLVLMIWSFVTWGKTLTIELPEGKLEESAKSPLFYESVESGSRFFIPGAKTEYDEKTGNVFTIVGEQRFVLPFNIQAREEGVLIKLPAGKFLPPEKTSNGKTSKKPSGETSSSSVTKTIYGRGGAKVNLKEESPENLDPEQKLCLFRYEQVETRLFSATLLPSPGEVCQAIPKMLASHTLLKNIGMSFSRVGAGFLVAILVAFPLGILMGSFSKFKSMFTPIVVFGGYTPIPALVPLSMIVFGMNERQKVMFLALAFGIYLIPLIVRAVDEVDNVYLQTAYTLGATRSQTVIQVLLGIALPKIYDSMRLGFGIGWSYIMLVEMVDMGAGGIGASLIVCQKRSLTAEFYLNLIVIVVIAFVTDKIWEKIGDWLFPYRKLKQ